MGKIFQPMSYLIRFVLDPDFQERQPWVHRIISELSVVHHNVWTASRFFGGAATIWISSVQSSPWESLIVFLSFALTDWIDGKVARLSNGGEGGRFGALLDGIADKVFILPVLWWWGREFVPEGILIFLFVIEFGGSIFLYFYAKLFARQRKRDIYNHLIVGKIKFSLQVALACTMWFATYIGREWFDWKILLTMLANVVVVLAGLSVVGKVSNKVLNFFAPQC